MRQRGDMGAGACDDRQEEIDGAGRADQDGLRNRALAKAGGGGACPVGQGVAGHRRRIAAARRRMAASRVHFTHGDGERRASRRHNGLQMLKRALVANPISDGFCRGPGRLGCPLRHLDIRTGAANYIFVMSIVATFNRNLHHAGHLIAGN
jgi:hypothetical protein